MSTAALLSLRPGSWKRPTTKASKPCLSASRALRMTRAAIRNAVIRWKCLLGRRRDAYGFVGVVRVSYRTRVLPQTFEVRALLVGIDEALILDANLAGHPNFLIHHATSLAVSDYLRVLASS